MEKKYIAVANRVSCLIEDETLKEGDKLPSIRSMSQDFGVSINTVKEAYLYLENCNYILSKPGSGFYVNNLNREFPKTNPPKEVELDPIKTSLCKIYSNQIVDGKADPGSELAISSMDRELWPKQKISDALNDALRFKGDIALNYCMPPGYLPLREQIAIHSIKGGVSVNPDDIIITSGCTDGLTLALATLCKPGDTIAIESPMYFNFIQICKEMDLNIIEIPNSRERGLSIETLEFVIGYHDIKCYITIPNFNNPLGSKISDTQKEELVELLERENIPLIEDDVYSELYYSGSRPLTCKSFDRSGNVILCSSFSKNIAPGIRVGWIIPGRFYEKIERRKTLLNLGTSALPQIAITSFLKDGGYERHNRRLRATLKLQLEEIVEFILDNFPRGTSVANPEGGLVLWVECPKGVDTLKLFNIVKKRGILFAPGTIFSQTSKYSNYLRLNGGSWNREVREALMEISKEMKLLM